MKRVSFRTAGESHGRGLVTILEGIPAGLSLEMERDVDPELRRRHNPPNVWHSMQAMKAPLLAIWCLWAGE